MVKAGIIGRGTIGSEVYRKIKAKGWDVKWVLSSKGMHRDLTDTRTGDAGSYISKLETLDIVFLAIPTLDKGETALAYIQACLNAGVPVVTCEKGALSNSYQTLRKPIDEGMLGYSATVGGGSRLLKYLTERMGPQVQEVHAIVNGTLNYIFEGLATGRSLGEVVEETKKLGYAEPGAEHPLDVVNMEAIGDVPMKVSILFNVCGLTREKMRARDIVVKRIEKDQLKRLQKEAANRRYIVSITKDEDGEGDVIWGFRHQIEGWHITAGFRKIDDNPLFRQLIPTGVNNAILTSEGEFGKDGSYVLKGPGAGPGPTAQSMILDAEQIIKRIP